MEQWASDGPTAITTGAAHVGLCPYTSGSYMYNSFQHDISPSSFSDNFHIYESKMGIVGYIAWYVDNILIRQITPSSFPLSIVGHLTPDNWYLILNLAITNSEVQMIIQFFLLK